MEESATEVKPYIERIRREVQWVNDNTSTRATFIEEGGIEYVLYEGIKTSGKSKNLPEESDVLVQVSGGYPASQIDMPALPLDSQLLSHVVGSTNLQNIVTVKDRQWRFLSFHPYANGGGPPWDASKHGFHDYYNQLYVWLHRLM